jgi:hypothetical protein
LASVHGSNGVSDPSFDAFGDSTDLTDFFVLILFFAAALWGAAPLFRTCAPAVVFFFVDLVDLSC